MRSVTETYRVITKTKLRRCNWGHKNGLVNRGYLVASLLDGTKSWIDNFRTDVIDPEKNQLIRWDGRNILCVVTGMSENDF